MIIATGVSAADNPVTETAAPQQPAMSRKLWSVSVSQMIAGAAFDAWSSARMNRLADQGLGHESNPLFADSAGRYVAARAVPIECGVYAGIAAGQYLLIRKFPRLARPLSVLNFGLSGIGYSRGIHNLTLYNRIARR
jgi:hypothetical protein